MVVSGRAAGTGLGRLKCFGGTAALLKDDDFSLSHKFDVDKHGVLFGNEEPFDVVAVIACVRNVDVIVARQQPRQMSRSGLIR